MNLKNQKILIIVSSIVIIGFGIYYYQKFKKQESVFNYGDIVTGEIVKIGNKPKGGSRTYTIKFGSVIDYLDTGPKDWDKLGVGDKVKVRFLEGNEELISIDRKPSRGKQISLLFIGLALLLIIASVLHKSKKTRIISEALDWIDNKDINNKNLENYFRQLLIHPKIDFDPDSEIELSIKIANLYFTKTDNFQNYIQRLLNQSDWKVLMIYKSLVKDKKFKKEYFIIEFKRLLNKYSESPIEYYEKLIGIFMTSVSIDNKDVLEKIESILTKKLDKKQNNRIKNLKTST